MEKQSWEEINNLHWYNITYNVQSIKMIRTANHIRSKLGGLDTNFRKGNFSDKNKDKPTTKAVRRNNF